MAQDFLDVSDTDPRISYTVGGTPQTVFVVPFAFPANADLTVTVDDVVKTLTSDFTVAGAGAAAGGTVTFGTAQSNCNVSIIRNIAIELETHIPTFGPLDVPGINLQFSRFIMVLQELRARAALLVGSSRYKNLTLPDPENGKYLKWKADLSGLENDAAVTHAPNDYPVATQSEAEAGTLNTVLMTPLSAQQHYAEYRTILNVREFGIIGDDATDWHADIASARAYAHTNGKTLGFPDGTYRHSGTNAFGYEKLKVHALGDKVVLKHTGTGNANTLDGIGIYPGGQGAAGGVFGGPNRLHLEGNANTTNVLMVDNWHFGDIKIAGRNATNAILLCQDNGIVNASAVETTFDVIISTNLSGAFTTVPLYGIRATRLAACVFNKMIVESVGNVVSASPGVSLVSCNGNVFNGGTVESCLAGGISMNSGERNVFLGIHCEANGTQNDWIITGDNNTFIGCAGAATTAGQYLSGSYNKFIGGKYQSMAVQAGATENDFDRTTVLTGFTDNGTRTSFDGIAGISPKMYRRGPLTVSAATAVPVGGTTGQGLMFSTTANLGLFFGSGAPTIAAAKGSLYIRTDGTGTTSRFYVATDAAGNWTACTTSA